VFDDFVRVRWGDLEPAARLVVLDPDTAREVTTSALLRLRSDWSTSDGDAPGRPVEGARRHVLTAAVARAAHPPHDDAHAGPDLEPPDETPDPVVDALVAHLRAADPLDRALLAARLLWDLGPEDVARLLGRPAAELRDRDEALRESLAGVHSAARGDDGPAGWALDRDLGDAVDVLLHDLSDPPDPAALVEERARRVRRRTLVLGGAAAVAVAGSGAAVALRDPAARLTTRPLPGPTDRAWLSTSQWPARGPLAGDPVLRAFVAQRMRPGDRVLWAGDAGTRRIVVGWSPSSALGGIDDEIDVDGGELRVFTGARGASPPTLTERPSPFSGNGSLNSVAVVLPDGPEEATPRSLLVVLAGPIVTTASYSALVRPTAAGEVLRSWTAVRLDAGVCTTILPTAVTPGFRVRVAGAEGVAAGTEGVFRLYADLASSDTDPAAAFEAVIAGFTGIAPEALTTTVTSTDALDGGLFDEPGAPRGPNGARVVAMRTTTPEGAVLRSSVYVDERGSAFPLEAAIVVPAEAADVPWLAQAPDPRPGRLAWLVLHPSAASVQLTDAGGGPGPSSPVVDARGRHATVVVMENPGLYAGMRVVLRDARGRRTYDAVPPVGRYLFDA